MKDAKNTSQHRITVSRMKDSTTGRYRLRGLEISDRDRANVFGEWHDWDADDPLHEDFDYEGQYFPASKNCRIGVEVEVRYAFSAVADDDLEDCAEVYAWDIYYWKLTGEGLVCEKDESFRGDYLYGSGPVYEALLFSPLIVAAARRIHDARFNYVEHEVRVVGSREGWSKMQKECGEDLILPSIRSRVRDRRRCDDDEMGSLQSA